ncbi:hypothetical protein BDL97_07G096100 [Sphagnum fallax]|nr:hypothetical protein BDL97_07G096100 [Sphagnum fallax]
MATVRKVWGFALLWPLLLAGESCGPRIMVRSAAGGGGSSSMMGCSPWAATTTTQSEIEGDIQKACSIMMQEEELHKLCAEKKIDIRLKVVQAAAGRQAATASEAKKLGATWVVLDRHLKREAKHCKELLQCNIVLVKPSEPKILRLNLRCTGSSEFMAQESDTHQASASSSSSSSKILPQGLNHSNFLPKMTGNAVYLESEYTSAGSGAPSSSPDEIAGASIFTPSDNQGTSSSNTSNSESSNSPFFPSVDPHLYKRLAHCSSGLTVVRGAILEAAAAELIEKGGSCYTPSDLDRDNNVRLVPPLGTSLSPASFDPTIINPMSSSYFNGSVMLLSSENTRSNHPGDRHGIVPALSRSVSRSLSRKSSRRESPAMSSQKASPEQLLVGGSQHPSFKRQASSVSQRDASLSQSFRAMLQSNGELFTSPPPVRGSLSELLLHPGQDSDQSTGFAKDGRYIYSQGGGEYQGDQDPDFLRMKRADLVRSSNMRRAILLSQNVMPGPPPLCSICQHTAPVFGNPPRRFSYAELELATAGFSPANFLAEGGYGSVHRGILPHGQAVAVKQHKLASTQGDKEFCSEVEVLSCAQHRNVVMLIGYCVEGNVHRLLVYEFICNGSLDSHLYGLNSAPLQWQSRQKIAIGAARGLRYLHEECRVGCIVHRDLRPNNILLTHDFEPLVGDFGLARWQPDGDCGVDTQVIGTFGYLAPEYTQSGQITEKADVYSFGVVLLELVTGRKAIDINSPKGEQCLTEWARPLLEENGILPLDPRLENRYSEVEVLSMLHTAAACIQRDPQHRPRMSQVLRMLEGEMFIDPRVASPSSTSGSSRRFLNEHASLSRNAKVLTNVAKASSDDQSSGSSDHSSPDIGHLFSSSHTTSRTSSPSSLPSV